MRPTAEINGSRNRHLPNWFVALCVAAAGIVIYEVGGQDDTPKPAHITRPCDVVTTTKLTPEGRTANEIYLAIDPEQKCIEDKDEILGFVADRNKDIIDKGLGQIASEANYNRQIEVQVLAYTPSVTGATLGPSS